MKLVLFGMELAQPWERKKVVGRAVMTANGLNEEALEESRLKRPRVAEGTKNAAGICGRGNEQHFHCSIIVAALHSACIASHIGIRPIKGSLLVLHTSDKGARPQSWR